MQRWTITHQLFDDESTRGCGYPLSCVAAAPTGQFPDQTLIWRSMNPKASVRSGPPTLLIS
ncbi:hypothetical protein ABIB66_006146 [Bradyrhizobium sp. F1.13.3]